MAFLDFAQQIIGSTLKQRLTDLVQVECVEDDRTLCLSDGSLVSLCEIDGSRVVMARSDMDDFVSDLQVRLASYFGKPGHALQFVFLRDPAGAQQDVERVVARGRRVAKRLGLEIEDVFTERERRFPELLAMEKHYLAVYTSPAVMSRDEAKTAGEEVSQRLKEQPTMADGQVIGRGFGEVVIRHHSIVESLRRDFNELGQVIRILDSTEALQTIRAILYPDQLAHRTAWTPRIMGQPPATNDGERPTHMPRMPSTPGEMAGHHYSNLSYPLLNRQIASIDAQQIDQDTVQLGDTLVSAFDMTIAPEVLLPFDDLVQLVSDATAPVSWRVAFLLESGGYQGNILKQMFLSIFAFTAPTTNRRIKGAYDLLREMDGMDDTIVRLRISFAAWAPVTKRNALRQARSVLRRSVERWGNAQTDSLVGDPLACVISSVPGAGAGSTAPTAGAPLGEALAMLPINRAASPWKDGSMLLSSPDGKLWPYQPGSSLQTTWVDIMTGTPGSGKSVLLNAINLAASMAAQTTAAKGQMLLPRIAILDIGHSSAGLISLLRDALPTESRHLALHSKLRNASRFAINPFDTQLGVRFPTANERNFLVNFLSILATPPGQTAVDGGMVGLIGAAIDQVYQMKHDAAAPDRYIPGDDLEVDQTLKEINHHPDQQSTWWELTDALFDAGRLHAAALAQRRAVPTLLDMVTAIYEPQINDLYGKVPHAGSSEPLIDAFKRIISAAAADYPILANPTRFDLSTARIVALDLQDVAGAGTGPNAERQTALMYMLARHALCRDYFLDEQELGSIEMSDSLRAYHLERARHSKQTPKRICMDEYHRTGSVPGIRQQVVQDIREGRKHNIQVALASQLLTDFNEEITSLATSIWICNARSDDEAKHAAELFGLNSAAIHILSTKLNGPSARGAPVFAIFKLKSGTIRQLLNNRLGPVELWAFSTTAEDVALRSRLYELIGPSLARQTLARRFPAGTAGSEIERRKARLEDETGRSDDDAAEGILETMAQELARMALTLA